MIEFASTKEKFDKEDILKSAYFVTPFGWSMKRFCIEDEEDKKILAMMAIQKGQFLTFGKLYGHEEECQAIMEKDSIDQLDDKGRELYELFQVWVELVVTGRNGTVMCKDGSGIYEMDFHLTKELVAKIVSTAERSYFKTLKEVQIGMVLERR